MACSSSAQVLSNSIIWGNAGAADYQIDSLCDTTGIVVSGIGSAVSFTSDYHLTANSAANQLCCTNKVSTGPARDVDGEARPKGMSWDIGADEVE